MVGILSACVPVATEWRENRPGLAFKQHFVSHFGCLPVMHDGKTAEGAGFRKTGLCVPWMPEGNYHPLNKDQGRSFVIGCFYRFEALQVGEEVLSANLVSTGERWGGDHICPKGDTYKWPE